MSSDSKITGQVVIWDRGPKPDLIKDGRHLVQIFGMLVADPKTIKNMNLNSYEKHTLIGNYDNDLGLILSGGLPEQREPFPDEPFYKVASIQQLMASPIWRV